MPATLSILYATYLELLEQGAFDLSKTFCPKCHGDSPGQPPVPLLPTKATVPRTVYFLEKDEHSVLEVIARVIILALARCPLCNNRPRLLPCDLLPRKLYSLDVIEQLSTTYNKGGRGLRPVAWELAGERTPSHTTLHAWTEGIGAYTLGRTFGEVPDALPADVVLTEAQSRFEEIVRIRSHPVGVDPRRYQSEARGERLSACHCLLRSATCVASRGFPSLAVLNGLILTWRSSFGLGFFTGIRCTSAEHIDGEGMANCPPKGEITCSIRGRSPPFASNRSLRSSMKN